MWKESETYASFGNEVTNNGANEPWKSVKENYFKFSEFALLLGGQWPETEFKEGQVMCIGDARAEGTQWGAICVSVAGSNVFDPLQPA